MPILDLYSKREKRKRGESPDIFTYTIIPQELRVQIVHILRDALGVPVDYDSTVRTMFQRIHEMLCREFGLFSLDDVAQAHLFDAAIYKYFLQINDTERALDIIEVCFKMVKLVEDNYAYREIAQVKVTADEAIAELNARFLEHGIGYQLEAGEIIRVDSKFVHAQVVKPVLQILSEPAYAGPNQEFLNAFDHYRHDRHKECLNDCLKAFESTLKVICKKRHWSFNANDTAKTLLQICFEHHLIPSYLEAHFSSLRSMLESGVPTIRNKVSGHGQGPSPTAVPAYLASYALDLTATSILLVVSAEKELR